MARLLSEMRGLTEAEIVGYVVAVAREVAAAHAAGTVHGNIRPSNVVIDDGTVGLGPPALNPELVPAHDVRCVGELLLWLLARNEVPLSAEIEKVARAAAEPIPSDRPGVADLLADLERIEAAASDPPEPPRPTPASTERGFRRKLALITGAVAVVVGAAAAAVASAANDQPERRVSSHRVPPATTATTSTLIDANRPVQVWPVPGCPPLPAAMAADLDGDGCSEPAHVSGTTLSTAAGSVSIGGDVSVTGAVTGNWGCGPHVLAVLRPTTGEVFVFGRWATRDREVAATRVAAVVGATRLVGGDADGDGCADLRVETGGGRLVDVRVGEA